MPIISESYKILSVFEKLEKISSGKIESYNKIIANSYPDKTVYGSNDKIKNQLRQFTSWAISVITKSSFHKLLVLVNLVFKNFYGSSYATLDSVMTISIRGPVAERFGRDSPEHIASKRIVALNKKDKKELVNIQTLNRINGHKSQFRISKEKVISTIDECLASNDGIKKMIGLLLCSGSRPNELFEKAGFVPSDEGPNWITQDYIAKRGGNVDKNNKTVTKPIVHLTSEEFINQLITARELLKIRYGVIMKPNGQINSTISGACNTQFKNLFPEIETATTYLARKIYGLISFGIYSSSTNLFGKDPTLNWWINNVCGHGETNLEVSLSYNNISLVDEKEN